MSEHSDHETGECGGEENCFDCLKIVLSRERAARKEAEAECNEQARLNGMGAEREIRLRQQLQKAEQQLAELRAKLEKPDGH